MGCGESKNISKDTHRNKHMKESAEGYLKGEGEEEKKESTPQRPGTGGSVVQTNAIESQQVELPDFLHGKKYIDESVLLKDLDEHGVSDLRISLNEDGYAVWEEMPSNAHTLAVDIARDRFHSWKHAQPHAVKGLTEANVLITRSYSPKRRRGGSTGRGKRCPDFAIYGTERLNQHGRPKRNKDDKDQIMNPHVVIQFGWSNEDEYEEHAIDDMMNYAGVGEYRKLERPNVAYLIKAIWKGKPGESPLIGFNVYELRKDERRKDVDPTLYRVGEGENVQISISATDMGLPVPAGEDEEGYVDPLTIDVHEIRQMIEEDEYGVFEAEEETA
jgi:hypothetical protein